MKKLFTLLTLLLCVASSAWADPTYKSINSDTKVFPTSYDALSGAISEGWISTTSDNFSAKGASINPETGEAYESATNVGCKVVKSGNNKKEIKFYVTNVKAIKVFGASSGSAERRIKVTITPTDNSGATTAYGTASAQNISQVIDMNLDPSKSYEIDITGVKKDSDDGDDCAFQGIWFTSAAVAKAYTVTVETNDNTYGTAAADASSLDKDEKTIITATPNAGYQFVNWSVEGEGSTLSSNTTNPTTLTMGTANTTVTATFSAINYAIYHGVATGGTYTISVAGGEATSTNTTATVGQTITLAGTPTDPANTYVKWNVTDADNNAVAVTNNQFTMPAKDVTIAPVFSKPLNTLFSMTSITGPTGDVASKETKTVEATFSEGASADVYNGKSSAAQLVTSNSINLGGSSGSYLHAYLPTKLIAGDVITLTDGTYKIGKTSSKTDSRTFPYTIPENDPLIGATELYIFKDNQSSFASMKIEGEGQLSDLEVTSSTTPTVAIGETSNIEISSSSTGKVTYTSSDEDVATVTDTGIITGVAGGEATITIEQAADANYRAGVKTITVTVPVLLKIKALGGSETKTFGTASFNADVDLSSNKKMDKGKYFGFTFSGDYAFQTGDVVEIKITAAGQNGTFKFYDSKDDNPTELYDTEVAPNEAKTYKFIMPASMNGVKTVYLRRGGDNSGINEGFNPVFDYVAVYRPDAYFTLNASGFATYSAGSDFTVVGATAYKMALNVSEGTMTGAAIDGKIPAGAGVLLKGEASAIVSILNTKDAEALTDNSLLGTTDANGNTVAVPEGSIYVLKGDTFKPYTGATFASNKAFFQLDKVDESRTFTMIFEDGETTGVTLIDNGKLTIDNEAGSWYSIQGVRHDGKPTRSGLYIFNGKKIVVK